MLFAPSVALQLTVVVPSGKLEPEAGVHVTVGVPQLSSAVGGVNVTFAAQDPIAAGCVMLAGHAPSVGAVESTTCTVKLQLEDMLLAASFATQVTVVVPNGKLEPDGGVQVTVGVPQLSLAVGGV